MRKKILFVMNNLRVGGAEKALISLLENFDYSVYDVDLQLFTIDGLFLKQLSENVNVLPPIDEFSYYDMPFSDAIIKALQNKRLDILYNRILAIRIFRSTLNAARKEQSVWKYVSKGIEPCAKNYDVAIGYLEKMPTYYIVEKVNAKIKIGFIHNDYGELGMDPQIDKLYFPYLDYIVTDSEECKNILIDKFPEEKHKVQIIYNIVSPDLIRRLSKIDIPEKFRDTINIVSVGRLSPQKGYELGIDALQIIKKKGLDFQWTILGIGPMKDELKKQIAQKGLEDDITFLGIRENHYPYVKKADIFLQTSLFEGKSVAIDEAKILGRPILVTNFNTAKDQIENNVTGIITKKDPHHIADKLELLIIDESLRSKLSSYLLNQHFGTESEIFKLYNLFDKKEKHLCHLNEIK